MSLLGLTLGMLDLSEALQLVASADARVVAGMVEVPAGNPDRRRYTPRWYHCYIHPVHLVERRECGRQTYRSET